MNPTIQRRSALLVLATSVAVLIATAHSQQTQLNVGDFAFVQANSDAPDTIGFVPLVDILAGTYVHITDNGRTSTSTSGLDWRFTSGRLTEGIFTWVAPTNILAGTVISFDTASGTHGMDLANGGDNLIAFQGTIQKPKFIGAVGWSLGTPWITTGTPTSNNSYLPSPLTLNATAVQLGNLDNVAYSSVVGGSSGTAAALLSRINNSANWTTNDTVIQPAPSNFTVQGSVSGTTATEQLFGYNFGFVNATYTNSPALNLTGATASSFGYSGAGTFDSDGGPLSFSSHGARATGGHSTAANLDLGTAAYFAFSLAVSAGKTFDITHIEFASQRDANAPTKVAVFASTNGFQSSFQLGTTLDLADVLPVTSSFDDVSSTTFSGTLEFRIYGWASAGTGIGNWDVDEVWVNGIVVPEPAGAALLLGGVGAVIAGPRRRRSGIA